MTRPPPRVLAVLLVVIAAALALTLVNLVRGGSDVAPPSSPAGRAVTALTTSTGTQALRAVPDDFEATLGYQPVLQDGELVRPDGDCSSPVPLPRTFEPACRQHDLGYDLLRHAALTGHLSAAGPAPRSTSCSASASSGPARPRGTLPAT
ncbi:hypothetical protein [Arsenicicoccus bolidensis]|uniref:Uncharacterized protein n=1 Tax=Arsenicicoccus bolidensis TaxID=229480 RepID=A0ABS9PZC7_9MICO|nr:hypothetical protein [Arsenicicoccus bolidensis]MCG7320984.1 hypothetical protein [Arsenicicoccus bolidensis]